MTAFVLVPGAGGIGWYWHRLVPELTRRGHTAVPVDLPGDDETAGLAEYADLVVAAARDLPDVVLVAQSMGGFSAPLACDRLPVRDLVLLNAMIPRPGESAGEWWAATGHAFPEDDSLQNLFLHDLPPEVAAQMEGHDRPEAAIAFGQPWPLERWPDVPTHVLVGADDRLFPREFQCRVARERLGPEAVSLSVVPGGHLAALSRPVELADALEACLTRTRGPSRTSSP
ncbi:MAG TPA: alpha/beta hydrolase [Pseudonocardia sp.]|nr:alpha/beta hydrolase [Pseudonocardia sp.]